MTGSAHDSSVFEHTATAKYPDWFFKGKEFTWANSVYTVNSQTIPIYKQPTSFDPQNTFFDKYVSRLRVRSEHSMGALKGCFQSLHGLRVNMNNHGGHLRACQWVSCCIILHNAVLEIDGWVAGVHFMPDHGRVEEEQDCGGRDEPYGMGAPADDLNSQWWELVAEINIVKEMGYIC